MKTYNNLYDKICSFENLLLAALYARRGKRSRRDVAAFEFNLEHELLKLQEELTEGTYQPGPYRTFYIYEPKKRMISAAPYRDRVVHHALCNVIGPIFERTFIYDSYANRLGKGVHKAVDRFTCRKNRYVLKCDIRKYFPSIDHEILMEEIRWRIRDERVLWLIGRILESGPPQEPVYSYFPGDDLFTPLRRRKGLPIGNQTSQFFANVYLNRFDHFVKEELRCRYYIRYVDDFVVLSNDKRWLHHVKEEMGRYLERLRLKLHPRKCQVFPVREGADFLGYRVFPDHRLLRKANVVRARRRLKRLQRLYAAGEISLEQVKRSVMSWIGHASHADTYGLRRKLFGEITFCRRGIYEKMPRPTMGVRPG